MNDIGDVLAKLLIDNPQFIPLYIIGLWFFIIKPMMMSSSVDESSEKRQNEDKSDNVDGKS